MTDMTETYTVTRFNADKGYGFAKNADREVFLHLEGYHQPRRTKRGEIEWRKCANYEQCKASLFEGASILGIEHVVLEKGPKLIRWGLQSDLRNVEPLYVVIETLCGHAVTEPEFDVVTSIWRQTTQIDVVRTPVFLGLLEEAKRVALQNENRTIYEVAERNGHLAIEVQKEVK